MESVEQLEKFLQKAYVDNEDMASPTIDHAIRDVLTDLLHLGDKHGINIDTRLADAKDVYEEEILTEIRRETGCID